MKPQTKSRLLFGHCFSGVQVANGSLVSTASAESFHHRCPGVLHDEAATRALRCQCECHQDQAITGSQGSPPVPDEKTASDKKSVPAKKASALGNAPGRTTSSRTRKQAPRIAGKRRGAGRLASPPSK